MTGLIVTMHFGNIALSRVLANGLALPIDQDEVAAMLRQWGGRRKPSRPLVQLRVVR